MNIGRFAFVFGIAAAIGANAEAVIIVGGPATPSPFSPTVANGNFEADSGAPLAFDQVTNWHNIEGDDSSVNFGQTSGMAGSPEANSQGGFIFGQMAANDTGYTVATIGDVFDIDFFANRFGGGYDGDEAIQVVLFTSTTGVSAATTLGDITILSTTSFPIMSGWENYTQDGIYTAVASDVGETIYLGFDLSNDAGSNVFPRLDVITWEVTPRIPEPSTLILLGSLLFGSLFFGDRCRR